MNLSLASWWPRGKLWLQSLSLMQKAVVVSALIHLAIFGLRIGNPAAFNRVFRDSPLEVILVNARSDASQTPPEKAQAIAQANLDGGGDVLKGRATSPLPDTPTPRVGTTPEDDEKRLAALAKQQEQILSQVKQQLAQLKPAEMAQEAEGAEKRAKEEKRKALVNLLAEIEKRINEENARPKKRYISPSTREEVYAVYYDDLRQLIEERGTAQFPQENGQKLYGELTLAITIGHQGNVLDCELVASSGKPGLDRRALALVRGLVFNGFSRTMRQKADIIVVVTRLKYAQDAGLQTKIN